MARASVSRAFRFERLPEAALHGGRSSAPRTRLGASAVTAAASITSLADHRARRLVERLLQVQHRIDACARRLLAGQRPELRLESLLDDMDVVLDELSRTAPRVTRASLKVAIERTCDAHLRWSKARLGSDEERSAASVYLDSVDALARAAQT